MPPEAVLFVVVAHPSYPCGVVQLPGRLQPTGQIVKRVVTPRSEVSWCFFVLGIASPGPRSSWGARPPLGRCLSGPPWAILPQKKVSGAFESSFRGKSLAHEYCLETWGRTAVVGTQPSDMTTLSNSATCSTRGIRALGLLGGGGAVPMRDRGPRSDGGAPTGLWVCGVCCRASRVPLALRARSTLRYPRAACFAGSWSPPKGGETMVTKGGGWRMPAEALEPRGVPLDLSPEGAAQNRPASEFAPTRRYSTKSSSVKHGFTAGTRGMAGWGC